jgi:predicted amidohydrolase
MALLALRAAALAWVALVPLSLAAAILPAPAAALAGALAGALFGVSGQTTSTVRGLLPVSSGGNAAIYALGWGLAASIWPDGEPAWGVMIIPVTAVAVTLPLRGVGAPRYVTNLLARTQERWLAVVHIARLGSDLSVLATLALTAASLTTLVLEPRSEAGIAAGAGGLLVAIALVLYGVWSYGAAVRRTENAPRLRVAAVVADPPPPPGILDGFWALRADQRAEDALDRYDPHVRAAAAEGARLAVLPEIATTVDESSRDVWIAGVRRWARELELTIVAPFFDRSTPCNELLVLGPSGETLMRYEKQHPGPIEPPRLTRTVPGPCAGPREIPLSTVICVDLDYGDLLAPIRRAGGVLAVPANDWPAFDEVHHQTSVWAAVIAGVPIVRATGHGISCARDAAGRVLARRSSHTGAGLLVCDLPAGVLS